MNLIERLESMANWAARGREIYGVRPDVLSEADARSSEAIETVRAMQEALRSLVDRDFTYFNEAAIGMSAKITREEVFAAREALRRGDGNVG